MRPFILTGPVNMKGRIPYKQMFAQAVSELRDPDCLYWFTPEDEQEIQAHNQPYQQESSMESVLPVIFEPSADHRRENLWTVAAIQKELSKHLKTSDVPNMTNLGRALKALRWPRGGNTGVRGYYLVLRQL